ncbi:glycoside hydrolase family 3 N-terminal domain-containing protein, partial [Escherichia coli]|uniref:glycoside hydrolase family 3 N-terminal domain-containing protein n=1 Tax=Escherichia coli TaxID=562 RepID=UPI002545DEEE
METAIDGFEGNGGSDLAKRERVLATVKHLGGDGDTEYGTSDDPEASANGYPIDQGITVTSQADLERIDLAPYGPAVREHDAGSVMPSYSSIDRTDGPDAAAGPIKAHADAGLLTGYLKEGLGFDGFVISDYNGIDQIPGDYASDVRT